MTCLPPRQETLGEFVWLLRNRFDVSPLAFSPVVSSENPMPPEAPNKNDTVGESPTPNLPTILTELAEALPLSPPSEPVGATARPESPSTLPPSSGMPPSEPSASHQPPLFRTIDVDSVPMNIDESVEELIIYGFVFTGGCLLVPPGCYALTGPQDRECVTKISCYKGRVLLARVEGDDYFSVPEHELVRARATGGWRFSPGLHPIGPPSSFWATTVADPLDVPSQ